MSDTRAEVEEKDRAKGEAVDDVNFNEIPNNTNPKWWKDRYKSY